MKGNGLGLPQRVPEVGAKPTTILNTTGLWAEISTSFRGATAQV